jgi:hypothetical protein
VWCIAERRSWVRSECAPQSSNTSTPPVYGIVPRQQACTCNNQTKSYRTCALRTANSSNQELLTHLHCSIVGLLLILSLTVDDACAGSRCVDSAPRGSRDACRPLPGTILPQSTGCPWHPPLPAQHKVLVSLCSMRTRHAARECSNIDVDTSYMYIIVYVHHFC